ncbi:MAG: zinc ribbon domain-containing protein [Deltaproteobacteria bacterium]|nr:zinc ribbon domain-containing protein [Deltaproteobacteria bacterium]
MPIYEYQCEACGTICEYLVGVGDDEGIKCSHCGSSSMNRILSVASFTLQTEQRMPGRTCCGREERCETPPCSSGGACRRE